MNEINGSCVIITGAASGIGFNIADKFLKNGAKTIVIIDNNKENAAKATKTLSEAHKNAEIVHYTCDVTEKTSIDKTLEEIFKRYPHARILINNAGVYNENDIKLSIDVNLTAQIYTCAKFVECRSGRRFGAESDSGTIINISSIYGYRDMGGFSPIYQASKYGVVGFTKSFGHQYNYQLTGVRVMALCPGFTRTGFGTDPDTHRISSPGYADDLKNFMSTQSWQDVDSVGQAAIDLMFQGKTGEIWLAEADQQIKKIQISSNI